MRKTFYLLMLLMLFSACGTSVVQPPMEHLGRRPSPLHFGLHVTTDPDENPIDPPERFAGYHAAEDFEVSEEELENEVPVFSICTGNIAYSGHAEGYGGVVVQRCTINRSPVTVIYGHLQIAGLPSEGKRWEAGKRLGLLAPARSYDSGYNRKHLHLGIHKGRNLDLRGYVQTEEELKDYIDPSTVLPETATDTLLPEMTPYWEAQADAEE